MMPIGAGKLNLLIRQVFFGDSDRLNGRKLHCLVAVRLQAQYLRHGQSPLFPTFILNGIRITTGSSSLT